MSSRKYAFESLKKSQVENPTDKQLKQRERDQKRKRRNQAYRKAEIVRRGCACEFCGLVDDPELPMLFEFHHIFDETKVDDVSSLMTGTSLERLIAELDKCVMLCPNCHNKFHADRLCMLDHKELHQTNTFFPEGCIPWYDEEQPGSLKAIL